MPVQPSPDAELRAHLRVARAAFARTKTTNPIYTLHDSQRVGFRAFLETSDFCGLTLSPVIAAIADASEGRPVTLSDDLCRSVFGCAAEALPQRALRKVLIRAGGRGGKSSRLMAPKALHAAWTVPLPDLRRGEIARALLIAPDKDLAAQVLSYCRGYIAGSKVLRAALTDAPKDEDDDEGIGTKERVALRRPDGCLVEIAIKAATRGGKGARSRTLVFAGLDEAAFFYADDGYTVTDKVIYDAAIQRVVPGGQVWLASTPWVESLGVLEKQIEENFGKHETGLAAIGGTRLLNPNWDPTGEIEAEMRAEDPDNAAREIDAVPFAAGTKVFFPPDAIERSINKNRPIHLDPMPGVVHTAGSDLGFRKNSSALAISRGENGIARLAYHEELRPQRGASLKPSEVCAGFAKKALHYNVRRVRGDLHYADTAHEEFAKHKGPNGERVEYEEWNPSAEEQETAFTEMRRRMQEGKADLPNDPRILSQLRATLQKPGPGGVVKIVLPKQGGAHGDLLMGIVLSMVQVSLEARKDAARVSGHREFGANGSRPLDKVERRYGNSGAGF